MIQALPKLKNALANRAGTATTTDVLGAGAERSAKANSKVNNSSRAQLEKLADATEVDIKFVGDPENQIIVFDLDETLIAGDKNKITKKREKQINAMGDRHVETVPKDYPLNKHGVEIKYVLRPGVEELLEYLHSRGYKMIACTRNYADRGDAICAHDPVLSKYISGCLGREDLKSDLNKDFKKFPHHPDNISFATKFKAKLKNTFIEFPKHLWRKFKSLFTGQNIRWNPEVGILGKHPPAMLELLAAKGNTKLQGLKAPRFLVDNSDRRETRDSLQSGNWAYINSNSDSNGDGKRTPFLDLDNVTKIELTNPETGEKQEGYEWVKKVIDAVEKGWKEQYKSYAGKEPKTSHREAA